MIPSRFFETFFVQEFVQVPSPFPPPWDTPMWEMGDGREIKGVFLQSKSDEVMIAAAQGIRTHGQLLTTIDANIDANDTLRRASDGIFFSIIGDPVTAPSQALAQLKVFEATITDRPS